MIWLKVKIPLYTKICSGNLSSFIFMAIETTVHFLYCSDNFALPFFYPFVIVNDCSCSLITRFSASPPNMQKIPRLFRLQVSAFGFHELLLH